MRRCGVIILLAIFVGLPNSYAENYYVAAEVDHTRIKVNDDTFSPLMSKIKFGVMAVDSRFLRGIGLEFVAGQSIEDDEMNGFNLDVGQHWAVYTTFSTDDRSPLKLAFNVGYSSTEIDTLSSNLNTNINETVEGVSYGFTFQQRFESVPSFRWTLDCTRIYNDDNIELSGCGVGVKYDF